MKIVRFTAGKKTGYGVLDGETIQVIEGKPFRDIKTTDRFYGLNKVRLLAPCEPSKLVCVGLNYRKHAEETNMPLPEAPLIFLKPSTAVIGPEDNIIYPVITERVDYEGELGLVMKRKARRVAAEDALDYVLGYTCVNDVTARDLQNSDGQWARAKGIDTFAPLGPCIETELDPDNVTLETYLNGERKQQGNTNDLIYPVRDIISFITEAMTLLPGDVIATGTPSGIGPMQPGDTVEIRIPAIGTLRNRVVAA
jgi:2-keto-4-pentenoate hydratase/2-oxohepta-3-ene-1,7-dioic acid hydratase in catechol pathway